MRGYASQATFDIAPVEGETRVIRGVPCTLLSGVYVGSRDGLTVTAYRAVSGSGWVVRVECCSTVIVDDLDAASAA